MLHDCACRERLALPLLLLLLRVHLAVLSPARPLPPTLAILCRALLVPPAPPAAPFLAVVVVVVALAGVVRRR